MKIGIVTARFNGEITSLLEAGAKEYLAAQKNIEIVAVSVPGAVEIPLAAKNLLMTGCSGVVALGAVIRGETTHYEMVCNSVERGLTHLMLIANKPIGMGVLTTENEQQALDRAGGKMGNKGAEAAAVTLEMIKLVNELQKESR
jgi:6,7-dimethyl-8-ribityllumazine synthase